VNACVMIVFVCECLSSIIRLGYMIMLYDFKDFND
jgi:hypothetical protein